MSQLTRFLKQNKSVKNNTAFAASKSFTDENGKPLEWTVKPLSTKENELIRDECTVDVPDGNGSYKSKLDFTKYKIKTVCACVVEPCLYDKELLDSYGVDKPEELVLEMLNDPGEFNSFVEFIFGFNGFGNEKDKIEEVKK